MAIFTTYRNTDGLYRQGRLQCRQPRIGVAQDRQHALGHVSNQGIDFTGNDHIYRGVIVFHQHQRGVGSHSLNKNLAGGIFQCGQFQLGAVEIL